MKIILLFAHPDDESFSCAGTIHKYVKKGAMVKLICFTRGEAGQNGKPPVCLPEELGEQRTQELKCAAKIIGLGKIYFLGLRDGTLEIFSLSFLAKLITPILVREQPNIVVTYLPSGISGHSDHIMVAKATSKAFKDYLNQITHKTKLYYSTLPQSMVEKMRQKGMVRDIFKKPFIGTPDSKITIKMDIKANLSTKIKALKCHKTQQADWERYLSRAKKGYADFEYFVLASTNLKNKIVKEQDLFEGL